jgi:hypothetical protein
MTTPDERRGRILSSSARGAKPQAPHGPLQRLLGSADKFDHLRHGNEFRALLDAPCSTGLQVLL